MQILCVSAVRVSLPTVRTKLLEAEHALPTAGRPCLPTKKPCRRGRAKREGGYYFTVSPAATSSRHFHFLVAGNRPQLVHDAHVELTNSLFRDAELLADLFQRHVFGIIVEAISHPNDLAFARL